MAQALNTVRPQAILQLAHPSFAAVMGTTNHFVIHIKMELERVTVDAVVVPVDKLILMREMG